jgi:type IV pilus assembly protein PilW
MNRRILPGMQAGMSLVELMVASVIALLGVIVIFQVYATNEGVRRSSTSGSDEQISGLIALSLLEREIKTAGYGINDNDILGCAMRVYDNQRTPNIQPVYPLAPVYIVPNAGTTPDVIRVIYGQPTLTTASVQLLDMSTTTDTFTLPFRVGFNVGDLVVVGQTGQYCTLAEVTALAGPNDLGHVVGTVSVGTTTRLIRFNDPTGTPYVYKYPQAKILNLGALPTVGAWPVYNEFSVTNNSAVPGTNNKLNVANLWAQVATANPIADQIVQMKAEYGIDDGIQNGTVPARVYQPDDNIIDKFTNVSPIVLSPNPPTNMQQWQRIKAVRLAVVSRSANTIDPTTGKGTACDATPAFDPSLLTNVYPVRWARGPDAPNGKPIDVSTSADWQCYKYKVYETTVPLRNVLWRQP